MNEEKEYTPIYIEVGQRFEGKNDEIHHFLHHPSGLIYSVIPGEKGKGKEVSVTSVQSLGRDQKRIFFKGDVDVSLKEIREMAISKPVKKTKRKVTKKKGGKKCQSISI